MRIIGSIAYARVAADIFHYGHLRLLRRAAGESDFLICGIYSDEITQAWNGTLIMPFKERAEIIESLSFVDEVCLQETLDPTPNLRSIHEKYPKSKIILFQGHQEWVGLPGTAYIRSIGGEIIKPDYYSSLSREKIRKQLNDINVASPREVDSYLIGSDSDYPFYSSTKANTLASLKPKLVYSSIEDLYVFSKGQWEEAKEEILTRISNQFRGKVVVRSSSLQEDRVDYSYAGFFHSELDVDSGSLAAISKAVEKVIASYQRTRYASDNDQVLIQSQLYGTKFSGVVFTQSISNNSPYYCINYDTSSLTDSVTSGKTAEKIEIVRSCDLSKISSPWRQLINAVKEIESLLDNMSLDIEFGIKENSDVVIFQIRPISASHRRASIEDEKIFAAVEDVIQVYKGYSENSIADSSYTLSDMVFWNPAEILGDRTGNLAYSIYRDVLLSTSWNSGLLELGYKKVDRPIMVRLGNKPYIEVETAFNSLLPETLDENLGSRLVSYYRDRLEEEPELHDKVEYELIPNCYSPTTEDQLNLLTEQFSVAEVEEFRQCLILLTIGVFAEFKQTAIRDLESIGELEKNRAKVLNQTPNKSNQEKLKIALDLLQDVKRYGAPQFVRMARMAFIGGQYLTGLIQRGVITERQAKSFHERIHTVTTEFTADLEKVTEGRIDLKQFMKLYGHLRPGTYDITQLPYRKNTEYLGIGNTVSRTSKKNSSKEIDPMPRDIVDAVDNYLHQSPIEVEAEELLDFIRMAIIYREKFKFEFTKNICESIELIAEVGQSMGFSRECIACLSLDSCHAVSSMSDIDTKEYWDSHIIGRRKKDSLYQLLSFPPLIFDYQDLKIVESHVSRPNFITNQSIRGEVLMLKNIDKANLSQVEGKVILIESADPGFDWIFSQNILGLVTRYGGTLSHMAIRCSELQVPAAIGCGEVIYSKCASTRYIELDCLNRKINHIHSIVKH